MRTLSECRELCGREMTLKEICTNKCCNFCDVPYIYLEQLPKENERLKQKLKQYEVNCLNCSHCVSDSACISCLKRDDIPYGMVDGATHEYAMNCEFYDGGGRDD